MSPLAHTGVLASGVQGGHLVATDNPMVLTLIAVLAVGCAAIVRHLTRRPPRTEPVRDEWGAQVAMGELCPQGWRAQITLYGWGAPLPDDAPPSRVPPVELEWQRYDEDGLKVGPTRHMWARSIPQVLQLMVDDRNAEELLEQLEDWTVE